MLTARKLTFILLTAALAALLCALVYTAFFKDNGEGMRGARFILTEEYRGC